ncbi:MAG: UPF0182 family protein [Eubacteriales bacterium]|nr:UPF0182 family protein [Eubacteriales bacterium]
MGIALLVILIIVLALILLTNFLTDWMWFREMNYVSVFFKRLGTEFAIGIPLILILAFVIDFYLNRLKKKYFQKIASSEKTDLKRLTWYTRISSVIFSLIVSWFTVRTIWFDALQFMNSTNVGKKDPIFHFDISFYLFRLGFLEDVNQILIMVIVLLIILTVVYYLILLKMHTPDLMETSYAEPTGSVGEKAETIFSDIFLKKKKNRTVDMNGNTGRQRVNRSNMHGLVSIAAGWLTILGVVLFLMLAVAFFLRQFELLHDHTGAVYGAGYVDVHVKLLVYRVLIILSLLGALTCVHFIHRRKFKQLAVIPILMIAVGIVGNIGAAAVQSLIVSPDELNKESTYLARNIKYTRFAYDLNDVTVKNFSAKNDLTSADIEENSQTFRNIRINDYTPVKDYLNQTQSIRQYYRFNDVDVDRYMIDGQLTQTYLSLRELQEKNISDTWLNRHLKYTHGYGAGLSKVNTVQENGQPDLLVKNIPPKSSVKEIEITEPRIYFGELSEDYSLVDTKEDEFDYPDGENNKYTKYTGNAGIRLNPFARLLFAIRERSLKLLVSTNITSQSKIIIYRNIENRVRKIMPYLSYDSDPYAVTVNGKIYWIIDAYTTSSRYPYSEPVNGQSGTTNYIRNSVKVVIDAYNGDTNFYIVDPDEPIAKTMQKIYPKLFKDLDEMPKALQEHLRYPDEMFSIQAKIYTRYHMDNVKVFYQDEDRWAISKQIYGTTKKTMEPNYFIVTLPGEKNAEFVNMIPYTPKSKQNLSGLLIARNDGKHYGELVVYEFPKTKTVYGPMQIEAQIDQNTQISQDFSLWSQAGSTYRRGTLFVVPVKNSLIYVEPIYLEASNSAIPEVKRVVVAYNDKIAYASTLGDCLNELFGDAGGTSTSADQSSSDSADNGSEAVKTQSDYIKDAQDAYNNAQSALKEGDWAKYGQYMNELEDALGKLNG